MSLNYPVGAKWNSQSFVNHKFPWNNSLVFLTHLMVLLNLLVGFWIWYTDVEVCCQEWWSLNCGVRQVIWLCFDCLMENSMPGLRILEHPKLLILKFFFGLQIPHRLAWFFVWSQQINLSQLLCMTMALLLQPRFLKTSFPRASSFPCVYCRKQFSVGF